MQKRHLVSLAMVFAMAGTAFASTNYQNFLMIPPGATQLKGSGSSFSDYDKWSNTFDLADGATKDVAYWHFVDSGTNGNQQPIATEMVLLFNENDLFQWNPSMGFSRNPGGNNPGWVVKTPGDWVLTDGYLLAALNQFNLSGYVLVLPLPPPVEDDEPLPISVSLLKQVVGALAPEENQFSFELLKLLNGEEAPVQISMNDLHGNVLFSAVGIGEYVIRERVPVGWEQLTYKDGLFFEVIKNDQDNTLTLNWLVDEEAWVDRKPVILNKEEDKYHFWAGIHLDIAGSASGTATLTVVGGDRLSTGQGWGFTYLKAEALSRANPLKLEIVGNKQTYGTAWLSINENDELVLTLIFNNGIRLAGGNEVVKVMVTENERWLLSNNQGQYAFKAPAPPWVEGQYTIVIPSSVFNMANFTHPLP